ncbi:hypothetical protein HMPREF1052_1757 [Pasteurella bettyae CCUG 2042]|uniref:Uncharacterized protein n=1 Tax=Pasteurella bettyae CCUG 2042 TaxID=1095749 RepID=I3DFW8_9PAST|nr:hypothetical protein HMPREF1052_1757 [Pasteurella bettyae CCUG 2042]
MFECLYDNHYHLTCQQLNANNYQLFIDIKKNGKIKGVSVVGVETPECWSDYLLLFE